MYSFRNWVAGPPKSKPKEKQQQQQTKKQLKIRNKNYILYNNLKFASNTT